MKPKKCTIFLLLCSFSAYLFANDFNFKGIPLLPNMSIESFAKQLEAKGFNQIEKNEANSTFEGKYWNFSSARIIVWHKNHIVSGFKVYSEETRYFSSLVQALTQKHGTHSTLHYGEESYGWVKDGGTISVTLYGAEYVFNKYYPKNISIEYQIVDTSHNSDL